MSAPGFRRERAGARPAANKQTMIVEGQGMGFWTRVRLPSTPLREMLENAMFSAFLFLCKSKNTVLNRFKSFKLGSNLGQKFGQKSKLFIINLIL